MHFQDTRLELARHIEQDIPLRITPGADFSKIIADEIRDSIAYRPFCGFANINDT